jgi:hypothetical protein
MMFEKIAIGIKTFLRDEQLFNAVDGVLSHMPGAQLIIADDGEETIDKSVLYGALRTSGDVVITMPFDSGFGAKSNAIAAMLTRPYLLVGSDDFIFDEAAADGVVKLLDVLEAHPGVDIASGRVDGHPYEFDFKEYENGTIEELPVAVNRLVKGFGLPSVVPVECILCDLTVNYSLVRKTVFDRVSWDQDVKIGGGEHAAFFLDCKRAGLNTVYVPDVNINQQMVRNSSKYNAYRSRANSPARPCFDRRGVKKYVLWDGRVDYDSKQ